MTEREINNSDVMIALNSMALVLGEDQTIVEITDEDDDGNTLKVTPISVRFLKKEYLKLLHRVKELEEQITTETIIEECN